MNARGRRSLLLGLRGAWAIRACERGVPLVEKRDGVISPGKPQRRRPRNRQAKSAASAPSTTSNSLAAAGALPPNASPSFTNCTPLSPANTPFLVGWVLA